MSIGSVLAMKYATSYWRILSPFIARFLHSTVQPLVKAAGNHATTTAFLPRKSDSLYIFPSEACSEKSGAVSPRRSVMLVSSLASVW